MRNCYLNLLLVALCLLGFGNTYAQKEVSKKPRALNKLNLFLSPQLYLNSGSIANDNATPDVLSSKNTLGFQAGAEVERITSGNLILNAGLVFGTQSHNVSVNYNDFSYINPDDEVLGNTAMHWNYKATVSYLAPRIMIGYRFGLVKKVGLFLDVKVGLSSRFYLNGYHNDIALNTTYTRNDTIFSHANVLDNTVAYGKGQASGLNASFGGQNIDVYIGIAHFKPFRHIKDVSAGFIATRSLSNNGQGGRLTNRSWNYGTVVSTDSYKSRDFSLGFRIAIGI